ncbi:TPA: Lrp/AsnC family transcriptional regulator [Candidatus Woesearchaeota archaeon]|nr:Lrp/AsnC family transcriptional regulator [Candidatus Woesearchaeota archaeon]
MKYCHKIPELWWINKLIGKYQLYTLVYIKDVSRLEEIIADIGEKFGKALIDYRLLLLYQGTSSAHNYLYENMEKIQHDKVRFASKDAWISNKEIELIHTLAEDPRMSFTSLAKLLKCTLSKARSMYEELVEKEVILYIRPSISGMKLGYIHRHIVIKIKFRAMKHLRTIHEYLSHQSSAKAVYLTLGRYDIIGRFIFKDVDELRQFKEDFFARYGDYIRSFFSDDYYEDKESESELGIRKIVK